MSKRSIEDLIDTVDPAWFEVRDYIYNARNDAEALPIVKEESERVLLYLQVTTHSALGAVAFETGGILIDHGWLRFLGSGHERMPDSLLSFNRVGTDEKDATAKGFLVVAYDVVGGFFAINGGAFAGKPGTVFYFAPDTLKWESTDKSYYQFLLWALSGDLDLFYENMRWPGWQEEIAHMRGDQGISIYPFLFLEKELPVAERSHHIVPMSELWKRNSDLAQQLKDVPPGAKIRFHIINE